MTTIAVTGAAGAVGSRTIRRLSADLAVTRVIALDQAPQTHPTEGDRVVVKRMDVLAGDLAGAFTGVDSVVHLAEDGSRRGDAGAALLLLNTVLEAVERSEVRHLVVLSSAAVYGAHADNPIPLTESEQLRPNIELEFAMTKQLIESRSSDWAARHNRDLAIMRPTTTVSETGVSWVAAAIRAAASVRPDQADPPVQFLHHEDLSSALALVARQRLSGAFNVAPDGWIGPEAFRELIGGVQVRVPVQVSDRLLAAGRRFGIRPTPEGIEPYVRYPWVVANDRLRGAGWAPSLSNEETFVISMPSPPWAMSAQRRQEVALGVAGFGVAGAAAMAAALARKLSKP
ncbi:MAG: NAD-dependent epimerase/dehydratase family protein [Actinomycetota bacterium]|nr:NAD-dependent epimerase/dehydratase family protein [Actinomycetota bacterium]